MAGSLVLPFAAASALVILASVYLTLQLSAQAAERAVVRQAEQQAQRIGLHLNHKLAHHGELATANGDTSIEAAELDNPTAWAAAVDEMTAGLGIAKFHVFALDRRILFSTDAQIIGTVKKASPLFDLASVGKAASKLERNAYVPDESGLQNATKVLETYLPIWNDPKLPADRRELVGVMELYQDVHQELAFSLATSKEQLASTVASLLLLFAILLGVVIKFERVLKRGVREQERLQARASELLVTQAYNQQLQAVNLQLEERTQQAEQASRLKSEFLANMSHELRTPLNAIIGFSDVLIAGMLDPLTPDQKDSVTEIRDAGKHLLTLISDILDISKIEAGKLAVDQKPMSLATVVQDAERTMEPLVAAKGHTLTTSIPDGLPLVSADDLRVRQILLNLLSNAVKFTPAGGKIDVAALQVGQMIQVTVADSGVGILPELQETVFQKFERVERKGAHELNEGTGLGLPLARQLAELHGGTMWCESEPSVGSQFHFTLWVAEQNEDRMAGTVLQAA